jgi:hypothetical protein
MVTAEEQEDFVLDCYRLADRYHQSPDVFLGMPITHIRQHIEFTLKLIEAQRKAAGENDDDG